MDLTPSSSTLSGVVGLLVGDGGVDGTLRDVAAAAGGGGVLLVGASPPPLAANVTTSSTAMAMGGALLLGGDDMVGLVPNDSEYRNCSNDYCVPDEDYLVMMENYVFPTQYEWLLIGLHVLVFCVGLVGNALVCAAVYRNPGMRTVTNYFLVNLAVADFLVILLCLPPTVVWDVTETWFMGTALCKIVLYFQAGVRSYRRTISIVSRPLDKFLTLLYLTATHYTICLLFLGRAQPLAAPRSTALQWISRESRARSKDAQPVAPGQPSIIAES